MIDNVITNPAATPAATILFKLPSKGLGKVPPLRRLITRSVSTAKIAALANSRIRTTCFATLRSSAKYIPNSA